MVIHTDGGSPYRTKGQCHCQKNHVFHRYTLSRTFQKTVVSAGILSSPDGDAHQNDLWSGVIAAAPVSSQFTVRTSGQFVTPSGAGALCAKRLSRMSSPLTAEA